MKIKYIVVRITVNLENGKIKITIIAYIEFQN